jgi:hypothetical protein
VWLCAVKERYFISSAVWYAPGLLLECLAWCWAHCVMTVTPSVTSHAHQNLQWGAEALTICWQMKGRHKQITCTCSFIMIDSVQMHCKTALGYLSNMTLCLAAVSCFQSCRIARVFGVSGWTDLVALPVSTQPFGMCPSYAVLQH